MIDSLESEFQAEGNFEESEVSPQEIADHTANMFATALEATKLFSAREVSAAIGTVNILGAVKDKDAGKFAESVIRPMLFAARENDVKLHIGTQFMLKGGIMKYGWVVSFASNNLRDGANALAESFSHIIPRMEVTEAPLMGGGTPSSGGLVTGRKGAAPIGGGA